MPEGDTIHKLAHYLGPRLKGRLLYPFKGEDAPRAVNVFDDRTEQVRAVGKNLLIALASERTLRVHLGMYGTWHHYGRGAPWRKSARTAGVILATKSDIFVCFRPTQVDLITTASGLSHPVYDEVGPDLMDDPIHAEKTLRRIESFKTASPRMDDLLLDQRIHAGIGNVYKSELLFLEGLAPSTPVHAVANHQLIRLYDLARQLLRLNRKGGPRVTTSILLPKKKRIDSNLWVYGRHRQPCFICGASIVKALTGRHQRITYWCPNCQCDIC